LSRQGLLARFQWPGDTPIYQQVRDLCGDRKPWFVITTNGDGWANWRCQGGSVSAWVEEELIAELGVVLD
jgi:hypothetical protein